MTCCRSKYKKVINQYKFDRVVDNPLSKHCKVYCGVISSSVNGYLLGDYVYFKLFKLFSYWWKFQPKCESEYYTTEYFRYYVGDHIRKDDCMYYETGIIK